MSQPEEPTTLPAVLASDPSKPTPTSMHEASPKSWHGPVKALDGRVTKLEVAAVATNAKLDAIEKKTDAQTVILSRIDGAVSSAAHNPWVRAFLIALALAFAGWLSRHGVHVEVPPQ